MGLRYPSPAVLPSTSGTCMLLTVGVLQFLGQLLLNRGFQLISATRGAAVNVLQVGRAARQKGRILGGASCR